MAKGDTFRAGGTLRVDFGREPSIEFIILKVNERGLKQWPWPDRIKLDVAYFDDGWKRTWYHADDPDVHPVTEPGDVDAQWAAFVLTHGMPPFEVDHG